MLLGNIASGKGDLYLVGVPALGGTTQEPYILG